METSFVVAYVRFTAKLQGGGEVRNMSFLGVRETLSAPSYSSLSFTLALFQHPFWVQLYWSKTSFSSFADTKLYLSWTWQKQQVNASRKMKWLMQNLTGFFFYLIFELCHIKNSHQIWQKNYCSWIVCISMHFHTILSAAVYRMTLSRQKCR